MFPFLDLIKTTSFDNELIQHASIGNDRQRYRTGTWVEVTRA